MTDRTNSDTNRLSIIANVHRQVHEDDRSNEFLLTNNVQVNQIDRTNLPNA